MGFPIVRVMALLVVSVSMAVGETPVLEKAAAVAGLVPLPMYIGGRVRASRMTSVSAFGTEEYAAQWPGTYFEASFDGSEVYFRIGTNHAVFHVLVDGGAPLLLTAPEAGVYRVSGLDRGLHVVSVRIVSESQSTPNVFGGFASAPGRKALTQRIRTRQIEFIGDSHTVGYGNASAKRECSAEEVWATTDNSRAFGPVTARHYVAEYQVNAISGRGVVRNYNGFAADTLPEAYPYDLFDKQQLYADAAWKPQVIVIALGTNDFSTPLNAGERWKTREQLHSDYEKTYVQFIKGLRAKNPGAYIILWATDLAGGEIDAEERKVVDALKAQGETRIAFVPVGPLEFTGCHWHPSAADDRIISDKLEKVIDGVARVWQGN